MSTNTHQRRLEGLILRITSEKNNISHTRIIAYLKWLLGRCYLFFSRASSFLFLLVQEKNLTAIPSVNPFNLQHFCCRFKVCQLFLYPISPCSLALSLLFVTKPEHDLTLGFARFFSRTDHDAAHFQAGPSGSAADWLCLPRSI